MHNIKIRPNLKNLKIDSYVRDSWGILREYGYDDNNVLDCSLGVNPFGYSPIINENIKKFNLDLVSQYPNPNYKNIKESIVNYWSEVTEFKNTDIFLGAGSISILATLTRLLIEKGSKILGYCPQFNEFENLAKILGGEYDYMNLSEDGYFKFSVDKFISLIDETYDVIYIDNPNNPTGQILELNDIESIAKEAKKFNIPVIVDEAYGDFMDKSNSGIVLTDKYSNIIVLRSFSKGFGLANIRLGYVILNNKLRKYYEMVNIPPFVFPDILSNTAISALEDKKFLANSRYKIRENKAKFINSFNKSYKILTTAQDVPILTIGTKKQVDLYSELLKVGVLATAGVDFTSLGNRFVRIRIPKDVNELIERFSTMEFDR